MRGSQAARRFVARAGVMLNWVGARPLAACIIACFLLRYVPWPFQLHWQWAVELPYAFRFWPLALILLAVQCWLLGYCHYRRTGRNFRRRWDYWMWEESHDRRTHWSTLAWLVTWLMLWGFTALTAVHTWAMERSLFWWFLPALAAFLLASYFVTEAFFNYFPFWTWANSSVVQKVREDLESGQFLEQTRARLTTPPGWFQVLARAADSSGGGRWQSFAASCKRAVTFDGRWMNWGSAHCLAIVKGYHAEQRSLMIPQLEGAKAPNACRSFCNATESLVAYLLLDWPEDVLSADHRRRIIADLRREMITLELWCATAHPRSDCHTGCEARVRQWMGGAPRDGASTPGSGSPSLALPRASYDEQFAEGPDPVRDMMELMFQCGLDAVRGTDPPEGEAGRIRRVVELFEQLPKDPDPVLNVDPQEIAATTWLILSSGLRDEVRLDVWFHMRRWQNKQPLLDYPGCAADGQAASSGPGTAESIGRLLRWAPSADDPINACARRVLSHLFHRWPDKLPEHWKGGIVGVAERAEQLTFEGQRRRLQQLLRVKSGSH